MGDDSDLLSQLDLSYQSKQEQEPLYQRYAPLTNTVGGPIAVRTDVFHIPAYAMLNGLIKWNNVGGSNVDLSLWARNITNKSVITYSLHIAQMDAVNYNEPRSFGATVRKSF